MSRIYFKQCRWEKHKIQSGNPDNPLIRAPCREYGLDPAGDLLCFRDAFLQFGDAFVVAWMCAEEIA